MANGRTRNEDAISADPRYAPALQGLAHTYVVSCLNRQQYEPIAREYQEQATIDRALCLAQKAVELDGNLPDAHVTLAYILHSQYRSAERMSEFHRALQLK